VGHRSYLNLTTRGYYRPTAQPAKKNSCLTFGYTTSGASTSTILGSHPSAGGRKNSHGSVTTGRPSVRDGTGERARVQSLRWCRHLLPSFQEALKIGMLLVWHFLLLRSSPLSGVDQFSGMFLCHTHTVRVNTAGTTTETLEMYLHGAKSDRKKSGWCNTTFFPITYPHTQVLYRGYHDMILDR